VPDRFQRPQVQIRVTFRLISHVECGGVAQGGLSLSPPSDTVNPPHTFCVWGITHFNGGRNPFAS